MARQVRATRTAISPRLATRTFAERGHGRDRRGQGHPIGLALLQERPHPLLAFGGDAQLGDALDGVALHVLHPAPGHLADQRLGLADRARARLEQLVHMAVHHRVEVLLGHRRADQADLLRAHGLEALAGEEQLARRRLADLGDHVRRDHGGHDAQAHLGEAEVRAQGGHRDVAGRHQAAAPAERGAVHARHDRLRALVDGEEEVGQGLRLAQVLLAREAGHGLHPLQVGARAEGGPAAAEHDHAHGVHRAEVEEHLAQLGDHQAVERVARVGPVEPDARHGALELDLAAAPGCIGGSIAHAATFGGGLHCVPPKEAA